MGKIVYMRQAGGWVSVDELDKNGRRVRVSISRMSMSELLISSQASLIRLLIQVSRSEGSLPHSLAPRHISRRRHLYGRALLSSTGSVLRAVLGAGATPFTFTRGYSLLSRLKTALAT